LSRDPVGTIDEAYRALGIELSDEARLAMHGSLRDKREGSSVRHVHSSEGFGIDPAEVRERFSGYCERFDLLD